MVPCWEVDVSLSEEVMVVVLSRSLSECIASHAMHVCGSIGVVTSILFAVRLALALLCTKTNVLRYHCTYL